MSSHREKKLADSYRRMSLSVKERERENENELNCLLQFSSSSLLLSSLDQSVTPSSSLTLALSIASKSFFPFLSLPLSSRVFYCPQKSIKGDVEVEQKQNSPLLPCRSSHLPLSPPSSTRTGFEDAMHVRISVEKYSSLRADICMCVPIPMQLSTYRQKQGRKKLGRELPFFERGGGVRRDSLRLWWCCSEREALEIDFLSKQSRSTVCVKEVVMRMTMSCICVHFVFSA